MPVTLFFVPPGAPDSGFSSVRSSLNYRASVPREPYLSNKFRCGSFYVFACYRGTGGRAQYVAEDWSEVHLDLPLSWRTCNYVGTIFGGSMYSAAGGHSRGARNAALHRPHLLDRAERFFGNRLRDGGKAYLHPQAVARCEAFRAHRAVLTAADQKPRHCSACRRKPCHLPPSA
jgi:hypothetical protein